MENGSRQDEGGKWKKSSRRQFLRRSGAVAVAVGSLGPSVDGADIDDISPAGSAPERAFGQGLKYAGSRRSQCL